MVLKVIKWYFLNWVLHDLTGSVIYIYDFLRPGSGPKLISCFIFALQTDRTSVTTWRHLYRGHVTSLRTSCPARRPPGQCPTSCILSAQCLHVLLWTGQDFMAVPFPFVFLSSWKPFSTDENFPLRITNLLSWMCSINPKKDKDIHKPKSLVLSFSFFFFFAPTFI